MTSITLLCSDINHPIFPLLKVWKENNKDKYQINLLNKVEDIVQGGEILFLISCSQIITDKTKLLFQNTLVLHASDLPVGRGWSPHVWDVISGKDDITLSLLEAKEPVDTGDIWKKVKINLDGTELFDEINTLLFDAELNLIEWACENHNNCQPMPQSGLKSTYYRKRVPQDSELDLDKTLDSQFNLLRVCDPNRFPAFFYKNGQRYNVRVEKDEN
ncbi:UDP-glucuronic acid dehydrogenase [Colwellia polaris]|uniref:UDP-glucuronic acid dehydrogenase n=1 Tax=Colwellia polaris TaxID=326537 RepID=UPI000A178089|nr:UDP-glucuronic acid dehydrogenase [Colwellia polaris]